MRADSIEKRLAGTYGTRGAKFALASEFRAVRVLRRLYGFCLLALFTSSCAEKHREQARPSPEAEKLFWVSPSRCLSPCTYYPQEHLVRVNDDGLVDEQGQHLFAVHAQPALSALIRAARKAGLPVAARSGFRGYSTQLPMFLGAKEAGLIARPGHSEHQIGTTMDFAADNKPEELWLAQHAREFGFVQSYPRNKQKRTGFNYEHWHYRYVGVETAKEIASRGWSMEEYFRAHSERGIWGDCQDCPDEVSRPACGKISAAGECQGDVLHFCMEGRLASVNCATNYLRCRPSGSGADCL